MIHADYNKLIELLNIFTKQNTIFVTIILTIFIVKIQEISKRNIVTAWLAFFVGTFFHELAHFIVALVTLGKPTWISIIPHKSKDGTGYVLGHVNSGNMNWKNAAFIGLAPLLLLFLSYWIYQYFFNYFHQDFYTYLLYVFLIISFTVSAMPSSVDLSHIFNKYFIINIIPLIILVCVVYFIIEYFNAAQFINSFRGVVS